ncbi:hypothetical protein [Streptomyces niveus]
MVEMPLGFGEGFRLPEYEATHCGEADDFAGLLERAVAVLRQWCTAVPARQVSV